MDRYGQNGRLGHGNEEGQPVPTAVRHFATYESAVASYVRADDAIEETRHDEQARHRASLGDELQPGHDREKYDYGQDFEGEEFGGEEGASSSSSADGIEDAAPASDSTVIGSDRTSDGSKVRIVAAAAGYRHSLALSETGEV